MQHFAAPTYTPKAIPAFTVTKLDGEYEVTVASMVRINDRPDKNGNYKHRLEYKTESRPRGWLITFPAGHSIHIADLETMKKMGFTNTTTPIVDEDGEVVGTIPNQVRSAKTKELTHA